MLANLSKQKLDKLKFVDDGLRQLQALEAEISKRAYQNTALQCQIYTLKADHIKERWALKVEIEELSKKNKDLS